MMYKLLQSQPETNASQGQTLVLRGSLVVRETAAPLTTQ
jgi:hypothetical protein